MVSFAAVVVGGPVQFLYRRRRAVMEDRHHLRLVQLLEYRHRLLAQIGILVRDFHLQCLIRGLMTL